jgi:hypothetical protein
MKAASTALMAKLGLNPLGSDNEWSVEYVNNVTPACDLWRELAARKPPECADIIARFAKFVHIDRGCWLWTGSRTGTWKGGQHGQFALYHGEHIYAHRLSYLLFNGPIPDGQLVRHTCDVGYCVQPSHLLVGTYQDNSNDAKERRRFPKYKTVPRKLSAEQVIEIRHLRMRGLTVTALAAQFGVTKACISQTVNFRRRQHLAPVQRVLSASRQAS